jgi:hypothetical protein
MILEFDRFIQSILEAGENAPPENQGAQSPESGGETPPEAPPEGEMDLPPEEEEPVIPEEIELAKLAVRAIYFNVDSKDVHNLKLRVGDNIVPFEKIQDYFEKTKNSKTILGFVEWAMDKYEGNSRWSEDPEVKGKGIVDKIKVFNKTLPQEQQLDNGKRVYWTRIILNCLINGNAEFNINISDVNEKNIKEIFRLLKQSFGSDTRGILQGLDNLKGPGVF